MFSAGKSRGKQLLLGGGSRMRNLMANKNANTIDVVYEYVAGAHLFWSKDERAKGLCVASRDIRKAFASVSHQLRILAKVNRDEDLTFEPTVTPEDFEEWVKQTFPKMLESKPAPVTATLSSAMPWQSKAAA